jgi:competence protein ComEA
MDILEKIKNLARAPKLLLILVALATLSSIFSAIGLAKLGSVEPAAKANQAPVKLKRSPLSKQTIVVDVEGAIEKPGVYELPAESRLLNALQKAGGLSTGADRYVIAKNFNLAKKLSDEEKVYLPFLEERDQNVLGVSQGGLTNLNTASLSQLELLPNIGPVRAQKIIDNRPYQQLEELVSKKVLGESTYTKLAELVCL